MDDLYHKRPYVVPSTLGRRVAGQSQSCSEAQEDRKRLKSAEEQALEA